MTDQYSMHSSATGERRSNLIVNADTGVNGRHITDNEKKQPKRANVRIWVKVLICLASIISALCVDGWLMPLVCITPLFLVFAYEHEKMERAMEVHDSPELYKYGTSSHENECKSGAKED